MDYRILRRKNIFLFFFFFYKNPEKKKINEENIIRGMLLRINKNLFFKNIIFFHIFRVYFFLLKNFNSL